MARKKKTRSKSKPEYNHEKNQGNGDKRQINKSLYPIFTLAEEARNTSTSHDSEFWGSNTKLRNKPVIFTSAGVLNPHEWVDDVPTRDNHDISSDEPIATTADDEPSPPTRAQSVARNSDVDINMDNEGPEEESKVSNTPPTDPTAPFYYDVSRPSHANVVTDGQNRVHVDDATDSSEDEIILFKGRTGTANQKMEINMSAMGIELQTLEDDLEEELAQISVVDRRESRRRGNRGGRTVKNKMVASRAEEDEMLSDYINNMEENGELDDLRQYISYSSQVTQNMQRGLPIEHSGAPRTVTTDDDSVSSEDTDSDEGDDMAYDLASLLANGGNISDYNSFDPAEWIVPNPRRRKGKAAMARMNFNMTDLGSDIEDKLKTAWKNDRLKKSLRKKERQQLRESGLLGKKSKADDLRIAYPSGMNAEQVTDELRDFLTGTEQCLSLPPMDKHARKIIHQLASKFNIKSKSIGKGDQRRPTLYRTKRTLPYSPASFNQVLGRMNNLYLPRSDRGSRANASSRGTSYAATSYAATSYRDGDVVGAAAPELGTDNRGRAMLEKMGWSRGTALGTEENQGILQPVTQTMKRSKAGLG